MSECFFLCYPNGRRVKNFIFSTFFFLVRLKIFEDYGFNDPCMDDRVTMVQISTTIELQPTSYNRSGVINLRTGDEKK